MQKGAHLMGGSWRAATCGALCALLSGCAFLGSMFGFEKPDLIVKSVAPVTDPVGRVNAVRLVVANIGGTNAYGAEYALRAADVGGTVEVELYRDVISLMADTEKAIELDEANDIEAYMATTGADRSAIATGSFRLTAVIDPENKIEETVEGNNQTVAPGTLQFE